MTRLKRWSESFPRRSKRTRSRLPVRTCFMPTPPSLRGSNKTPLPESWRREVYENALNAPYSFLQFRLERNETPVGRLVDLYRREGRLEDARRSLLNLVRDLQFPDGYTRASLPTGTRCRRSTSVARELIGLGFAADAVPLLIEAVNLAEAIDPSNSPRSLPHRRHHAVTRPDPTALERGDPRIEHRRAGPARGPADRRNY